ncbi:MAG: hypothetical protein C0592_14215 [Marinilabiliales bacterium]|nr:MAG: hypothetical protein C0592_14215 [Marinilabiliales bacterium]
MTQEIITYSIIGIALLAALYRIFRIQFTHKKQDGCGACEGGDQCTACPLKDLRSVKEKK